MKTQSTAITSVFCALFAGFTVTEAGSDTIEITEGGVTFAVKIYDDGRSKPYQIKWDDPDDGFASKFKFDADGAVTNVIVDGDKFKIKYDDNGDVESVTHTNARRTLLTEDEEFGDAPADGRRRLLDCDGCGDALGTLDGYSVDSVCGLVGYGAPLTGPAVTAIDVFCDKFALVDPDVVCEDLCYVPCLAPLTISLSWTDDVDLDLYVVEPFGGDRIYYSNRIGRFGYLDQDSGSAADGPEQYLVYSRFPSSDSSWSTGAHPVGEYWIVINSYNEEYVPFTVTATDGNGDVILDVEDQFDPDCLTGEVSKFYRVYFEDYVDNDCAFSDLASIEASVTVEGDGDKPAKGHRKN